MGTVAYGSVGVAVGLRGRWRWGVVGSEVTGFLGQGVPGLVAPGMGQALLSFLEVGSHPDGRTKWGHGPGPKTLSGERGSPHGPPQADLGS